MDIQTQIKATEALWFLRGHPALDNDGGDSLFNGAWFHMELCCKNGYSKWTDTDGITIWKSNPNWEKYKEYFDKEEYEEYLSVELHSARVPYKVVYGEPWKADHMEYWYETVFFVFHGDPYNKNETWDVQKWGRYAGPEGGANSFEEMLIKAAADVKETFGDFESEETFYTEAEKKNHNDEEPVFFTDVESEKMKGCKQLLFNDKHVDISRGLINLRWLKWYMTTDYAKKNWSESISEWESLVAKIETSMPEERKQILAKYT